VGRISEGASMGRAGTTVHDLLAGHHLMLLAQAHGAVHCRVCVYTHNFRISQCEPRHEPRPVGSAGEGPRDTDAEDGGTAPHGTVANPNPNRTVAHC